MNFSVFFVSNEKNQKQILWRIFSSVTKIFSENFEIFSRNHKKSKGKSLWKRKISEPFPHRVRLDFCQYGKPYRKRTKLATNAVEYVPRSLCNPRTCPSCVDGKHIKSAQQGPCKRGGVRVASEFDSCTLDELHSYPQQLCQEIFEHCQQRQWDIV